MTEKESDVLQKELAAIHLNREDVLGDVTPQGLSRIICIALDESEKSWYAFEWALKNLVRVETDLMVLLNVRPKPSHAGLAFTDHLEYLREIEKQSREASHKLLHKYADRLTKEKIACRGIALVGDAREEIVRECEELKVDTLVVGSRGLGTIKRMLIGSVSDYCVRECTMPVVVVKSK